MQTTLAITLLATACVVAGAHAAPPTNSIVPPDAKLQWLYTVATDNAGAMTEGPAVAPDGSIYFSFIPSGDVQGQILRYDPATGKTGLFAADSHKSNGLAFDARGDLIACEGADHGGRCISRWNVKTGERTILVDRFGGKRFNAPNDVAIDAGGRIYFTDPKYVGREPRELEHRAVYRIDTDGTVHELTHDVEKPNGVAISPDQKTLYVADTNNGADGSEPAGAPPPRKGAMKVYAFSLSASGEVNGPRRTIVDFGAEDGCDGMTVDVRGNLYLTSRSRKRPGVLVVDPSGKELAFIATGPAQTEPSAEKPVGLPSNCEFGIGHESRTLYVTIDKGLYRIKLLVDGYHIPWQR